MKMTCKFCGNNIPRRRLLNGNLERINAWKNRKFCNQQCYKNYIRLGDHGGAVYMPTRDQIEKAAADIRDSWSDDELARRAVEKNSEPDYATPMRSTWRK